jgi:hypothetical protein
MCGPCRVEAGLRTPIRHAAGRNWLWGCSEKLAKLFLLLACRAPIGHFRVQRRDDHQLHSIQTELTRPLSQVGVPLRMSNTRLGSGAALAAAATGDWISTLSEVDQFCDPERRCRF